MPKQSPPRRRPGEILNLEEIEQPFEQQSVGFPIVGIGASAGGLSAFEALFAAMPEEDPGMAFVLVQHLARDHKSILSELHQDASLRGGGRNGGLSPHLPRAILAKINISALSV